MAGKAGSGTSWVPSQGDALMEATRAAVNTMDEKYTEVSNIFKQLRSDDIIGESVTKDALLEVVDGVEATFKTLNGRLDEVRSTINELAQIANDAARANVNNTEEAGQSVNAASRNAANIDGTGA